MYDMISVGDATIDTFLRINDAHVQCNLNKEDCQLCLSYGDKIAVEDYKNLVAGNAANNAVGSSRLGMKTAIYVNVGSDDPGFKIKKQLVLEKVAPDYIKVNEGMESNYSAVINFQGERTILVYHQKWHYELPKMEPSKWVYYTSASPSFVHSSLSQDLAAYVKNNNAKMGFNPGTYQIKAGLKNFKDILDATEIFFVNVEEAKRILGIADDAKIEIKELLKQTREDLGLKLVVITDGRDGSYSFDGADFWKLPEYPGDRLEATGAGDAFATATCAALFHGKSLAEAMVWGSINGALVVGQIGPQAGLATIEKIEEKINALPNFKAEKF